MPFGINRIVHVLKHVERAFLHHMFGPPPSGFALIGINTSTPLTKSTAFKISDIIGDGFLLAVPKFRRTVEKRWKRKFGSPDQVFKLLVPKTNLLTCNTCGHHHERGVLCSHCYQRIQAETKAIQEKMQEGLELKPIENDVIVLYDGENLDKTSEFWKGKRIVEMKKQRPSWFSKNLLQKTTQQPSTSTDVKPTELA